MTLGVSMKVLALLHSIDAIRLRRSSLALDSGRLVGALDSGRLMGDFLRSYPSAWGRTASFAEVLVRPLSVSCQATFVARKAPLDSSPIGRLAATRVTPGTTMVPGRHEILHSYILKSPPRDDVV
jgi:hypothetical protein